jgi:hypothetical protein
MRAQPLGYLIRVLPEEIKFGELKKRLYLYDMKDALPYCTTGKAIKGYEESAIAKGENNDCVVRAFASAFEISYDKSHKYIKEKFGRKDRCGTYGTIITLEKMVKSKTQVNYKKIKSVGKNVNHSSFKSLDYDVTVKGKKVKRKMTVGAFVKQNPVGTFFMLVTGHAFTIKDGVVIGNYEDSVKKRRTLNYAFEIK